MMMQRRDEGVISRLYKSESAIRQMKSRRGFARASRPTKTIEPLGGDRAARQGKEYLLKLREGRYVWGSGRPAEYYWGNSARPRVVGSGGTDSTPGQKQSACRSSRQTG